MRHRRGCMTNSLWGELRGKKINGLCLCACVCDVVEETVQKRKARPRPRVSHQKVNGKMKIEQTLANIIPTIFPSAMHVAMLLTFKTSLCLKAFFSLFKDTRGARVVVVTLTCFLLDDRCPVVVCTVGGLPRL